MDPTNINVSCPPCSLPPTNRPDLLQQDPAAVKALLEQLRQSQAWRDTVASGNITPANTSGRTGPEPDHQVVPQPSVASLLSLLQPSTSSTRVPPARRASPPAPANSSGPILPSTASGQIYINVDTDTPLPQPPRPYHPAAPSKQELRSCSFQQALPYLARLSSHPEFVSAVSEMKKEQDDLERQLWEERRAIQQKHESKVNLAVTRAGLIGSEGLSQYEADTMTQAFRKDISKFDVDRALPAWDGLMSKHQAALEAWDCPAMYVTNIAADLQRQQQVIQVLEGITVGEGR